MKGLVTISVIALLIASCSTLRKTISDEKINDKKHLLISMRSYKLKGNPYHDLTAVLTDSTGNKTVYWITSVCNCIRKEKIRSYRKSEVKSDFKQYKLVADSIYALELNNDDQIVLQNFRSLPEIEMFCSISLLDSAKGFIQLRK